MATSPRGSIQTIVDAPATGAARRADHQPAGRPPAERSGKASTMPCSTPPACSARSKRAVTAEDYEALALEFQRRGQGACSGDRLEHGDADRGSRRGRQGERRARGPTCRPTSKTSGMFNQIVEIADVDYVPIYVTAEIGVTSYYVRADVTERVQQAAGRCWRSTMWISARRSISASSTKRSRRSRACTS